MSEFVPDAELEMVLEADGSSGSVANNLTTTEEGYVLDARQGPVIVLLLNGKVDIDKIVNNLTTTAAGYVLDARQGKLLKDELDAKMPKSGGTFVGDVVFANSNLAQFRNETSGQRGYIYYDKYGNLSIVSEQNGAVVGQISINDDGYYTRNPFAIKNGGTGAVTAEQARANLGITPANIGAVSLYSIKVVLPVSGWSNKTQTVTVSGIATSGKTQFVTPDPASWQHAKDCGVYVSAYAANSITFACETTPTAALTMGVAIFT